MAAWIRLYTNVVNDPKVQQLPASVFKFWVNLLCIAGQEDRNGELPSVKWLTFSQRISEKRVNERLSALKRAGLVDQKETDGDTFFLHNWNGRQFTSDSSVTRVRRYRERNQAVTGNADVAPQNRTEQNRTEQSSLRPSAKALSFPDACRKFLGAERVDEQVGAMVDLGRSLSLDFEGPKCAGIVKKHGHGQRVVDAVVAAAEKNVGEPHQYVMGVLRNAEGRQRTAGSRAGAAAGADDPVASWESE